MTLSVPVITEDMDVTRAALAYAAAGWYVVPVKHDTKAPTVLGKGWQHQSSRDPEQIVAWFAGTNHALGLHVGRSGAIVFDLDEPDCIPAVLQHAIETEAPPYQSSRVNVPNQGHYVFAVPPGRYFGNGRGGIMHPEHKGKWGEVRGANGIIVAEPSLHTKPGGRYHWVNDEGEAQEVPELPSELADLLPDGTPSSDVATDETVATFLTEHRAASAPHLLTPILRRFAKEVEGQSRHEALVAAGAWAMRDARAGIIDAQEAYDQLQTLFLKAMAGEAGHGRFPKSEFRGVMAWAVGQALAIDPEARRETVVERVEKPAEIGGDWDTLDPTEAPAAAPAATERRRDSDDYWYRDFLLNKMDVDSELLLKDVIGAGPIAIARDHRFWSYEDGVWREDNLVVRERVIGCLRKRVKPNHWSLIEQMLQVPGVIPALEGDPTPDMINFRNGMLDWKSGTLMPHAPSYLSTIQLPVDYDMTATCPAFDEWLSEILSPDYVKLAWQMIGYLMMSGNPLQVAFLMLGKGGNGKGTLMRVIKALLGDENISALSLDDITGNRFAPAGLYGKIANLAGDIDSTFQESTAKFKMLTGEDMFTAENKNAQPFRFTNWAVPVFSANKIFGSSDTTEGYLRRWIIMKFDRTIPSHKRIAGLERRFMSELSGIAWRGLEALRELMEAGHFKDDGDVKQGKEEFTEALDQVRQWVSECTAPDDGSEERTALYESYKMWAHKVGVGTLSAKEFYSRLDGAGYPAAKVHGVRRHKGLRVTVARMMSDAMLTES
jgi:P4 family phage/plasmid primase-like protien